MGNITPIALRHDRASQLNSDEGKEEFINEIKHLLSSGSEEGESLRQFLIKGGTHHTSISTLYLCSDNFFRNINYRNVKEDFIIEDLRKVVKQLGLSSEDLFPEKQEK